MEIEKEQIEIIGTSIEKLKDYFLSNKNLDIHDEEGITLLYHAAMRLGNINAIRYILSREITSIITVAKEIHSGISTDTRKVNNNIQILLEAGVTVEGYMHRHNGNISVLHWALKFCPNIFDLLILTGIEPNFNGDMDCHSEGYCLFTQATNTNRLDIVQILLDLGYKLYNDDTHYPRFSTTTGSGSLKKMYKFIWDKCELIDATIYDWFICDKSSETLKYVLHNCTELSRDIYNQSMMNKYLERFNESSYNYNRHFLIDHNLVNYEMEYDTESPFLPSLLHYQTSLRLCLEAGIDINRQNKLGDSLMHEIAASFDITRQFVYSECVQLMADNGSDLTLRNNGGFTAMDLSVLSSQRGIPIIKLLKNQITLPAFETMKEDNQIIYLMTSKLQSQEKLESQFLSENLQCDVGFHVMI